MNTNWKEEEADMKYSIGEIANLLGISIVAVRNYEKCGLIEPQRNEQNNYREYNAIDLNLIRRARTYMSYGFSLGESTYMLRATICPVLPEHSEKRKRILNSACLMSTDCLHLHGITRHIWNGFR